MPPDPLNKIVSVWTVFKPAFIFGTQAAEFSLIYFISPGAKYFCSRICSTPSDEKVIFAFERIYITSSMRKSIVVMPVVGSVQNTGHEI